VLVVGGEVAAWAKGNLIHELELCLMAKVALLLALTTITAAIPINHFIEVASDRTEAEATTSTVRAKADRIPTSALMMVVARTEASLNLNSRATATNATSGATKKWTADLWHQRLAHLGYDNVRHMYNKQVVSGMHIRDGSEKKTHECDACAVAKATRKIPKSSLSSYRKQPGKSRKKKKLDIDMYFKEVNSDLIGPMSVQGID
jgi:hypothetical protein